MGRQQILPRGLQNLAPRDLQVSRDIFGRGKTLQSRCFWLQAHALPFMWLKLGLCRPIKNIRFIIGEGRSAREALSISGAERSRRARKRSRRGFGFMRRAELHKRD